MTEYLRVQLTLFAFLIPMLTANAQSNNSWMKDYDFVFLDSVLQHALYDARYAGPNNFIGSPIKGYHSDRLVMTRQAALALRKAEQILYKKGLGLKIFDTYRPQRAVNHFMKWAKDPTDTVNRHSYYPEHDKSKLFDLGYISSRSGHTRGSTIDLTLYSLDTGLEVDMGGPYDYFGERSHHAYDDITKEQARNRLIIKEVMLAAGFKAYSKEWWHYTLLNEPYEEIYFDYIVKKK